MIRVNLLLFKVPENTVLLQNNQFMNLFYVLRTYLPEQSIKINHTINTRLLFAWSEESRVEVAIAISIERMLRRNVQLFH